MINKSPLHYYECPICGANYGSYEECHNCINTHPGIEITAVGGWDHDNDLPMILFVKVGEKKVIYQHKHTVITSPRKTNDELPSTPELSA